MFDLFPSIVSDLIAGLVGSSIVAGGAVLARRVARGTAQRFANWLGWPAVAAAFFGVPLLLTLIDQRWMQAAIVLAVQLLVAAPIIVLRFGPAHLHLSLPDAFQPAVRFVRAYPWRTLTTVFFLITITLLALNLLPDDVLKGRIVFVVDLDDSELLVFRDILDPLEPELGAEIFLVNIPNSRIVARLDRMVASGDTTWDLIAADNNMLGLLGAKELVQEVPAEEFANVYPPSLMISLRPLRTFEGTFYFVPFRPNVKIAFYNEEQFAQYGLAPPRTWDELLEVAKVFEEREGVGRVAIQGARGPVTAATVFEFVTAAGGDPLTLDDGGSRAAFEFLQRLEPYLAREYVETRPDTANELLIDDAVFFVDNWTFAIKVVVEDFGKEEIRAVSGWSGPVQESHVLGGDVLAIPKGAPNAELAIRLIELLVSKEEQQEMRDELTWMPVRLDAYGGADPGLDPYFESVRNAFAHAEIRPIIPQWPLVEDCLSRAFRALIVDGQYIGTLEEWSSILKEISSSQYVGHRVERGDTFQTIASRYHTTPTVLAEVNRTTTRALAVGQVLIVLPGLQKTCSDVSSST